MKVDGHCHCSAITFEAEVEPDALTICHCTDCQTLTGSAFRINIPAPAEHFVLRGTPKTYVNEDSRKRQPAPSRLLRELRHTDLCQRGGQSAGLCLARRRDYSARGLQTAAPRLAQVGARLGGWARRCAGRRERLELINQRPLEAPLELARASP